MRKFALSDLRNKHFLALTANGVLAILGIGIMGLLYRSLPKSDVGVWFFFLTIYSLGDAIRNGLLQTATIKFYAGTAGERAENVLGSVWYLAIIVTCAVMALDLVAVGFLNVIKNESIAVSIQWMGVTFISSLPFTLVFWILYAEEKYGKILWIRLVNSGSMIIYIIILILLHKMTLQALLWCNFLTNCLTSFVGMVTGMSRFRTIIKRKKECISELMEFGKYSFGSTVVSRLLSSADTFIITFLLGPTALAIYNLPVRLMEIEEIPLRTFVSTGMSAMAAAYNKSNIPHVVHLMNKYAGMLTIAFIALTGAALIFADLAIYLLGGHKYVGTEAANVYRIFMILALLYPIERFSGVMLDMLHKPKINFYKVIIMLFVCVGTDFLGIAIFPSIYSVAIASFITVLSGLLYAYVQLNKDIRFSFRDILSTGYAETKLLLHKMLK